MTAVLPKVSEALKTIQPQHVKEAICEFDQLGREGMIDKYGGAESLNWYLLYNDHCYDVKLIVRAAYEKAAGTSLRLCRGKFTSASARRCLDRLGFRYEYLDKKSL